MPEQILTPRYGLSADGETITLRKLHFPTYPPLNGEESDLYTVLDIETTGLDRERDEVIELALMQFAVDSSGKIKGMNCVYQGLQQPTRPLSAEITRITGLTDRVLEGQKLDLELLESVFSGSRLIIAHNAAFDRPFVDRLLPSSKQTLWGCSMAQIDWYSYGHRSRALEALCQDHGFFYEAHRAMADVEAAMHLLQFIVPGNDSTHFLDLIHNASGPEFQVLAQGAPYEMKDRLKQSGFRWNPSIRVWHKTVSGKALEPLLDWLTSEIYCGVPNRAEVRELPPSQRFSLE